MLTLRGIDLLLTLDKTISGDGFVVIDAEDISVGLLDFTADDIAASMKELKVEGLIVIKLADGGEYCLKITEQGRNRAAEIIAMREKKANAQVLRVIKDDSGKTFVELSNEDEQIDESADGENENKDSDNTRLTVVKKTKSKRYGLSAFIWGAFGGIITSVAAILTYVYAFAGV